MNTPTTNRLFFVLLASAGTAMFPARAKAATYSLAGDFSYTENITKAAIEITPASGPAMAVKPVAETPSPGLALWYN